MRAPTAKELDLPKLDGGTEDGGTEDGGTHSESPVAGVLVSSSVSFSIFLLVAAGLPRGVSAQHFQ